MHPLVCFLSFSLSFLSFSFFFKLYCHDTVNILIRSAEQRVVLTIITDGEMRPDAALGRPGASSGLLGFNGLPLTRSWAGWPAPASAAQGPLAGWRRGRPPPGGSPAHDLVGQQHAAHLRVLVLAFIHDGLRRGQAERGVTQRLPFRCHPALGAAGLRGWQVSSPSKGGDKHTRPFSYSATSVVGLLRTARLPSSSQGRTPGLSSRGLRGGRGRACRDPGTAGEGAQPPSRRLAPGPPQPGGVHWPLSYTKSDRSVGRSRSECAATKDTGKTPGAGAALLAPRGAAQAGLPRRQTCALPAAHTQPPAPRSPSRGRRLGLRGSASPGSRKPCTAAARARATPGSWWPAGGPGPGGRPCPRGHVLLAR